MCVRNVGARLATVDLLLLPERTGVSMPKPTNDTRTQRQTFIDKTRDEAFYRALKKVAKAPAPAGRSPPAKRKD